MSFKIWLIYKIFSNFAFAALYAVFHHWPGAIWLTIFLLEIQIWWKLRFVVIPQLAFRSQQIFAHATTAQLWCHMQKFVAITLLEWREKQNENSIEFELGWGKTVSKTGPRASFTNRG